MQQSSTLTLLKDGPFRTLWLISLGGNMTMWMNDVAAAWLMTSLTTNPLMVALVQTASTLPIFVLGIPGGALADIVDRRLYFAATQLLISFAAVMLAILSLSGRLNAPMLLAWTLVNGVGIALRWPIFAAILPQFAPRGQLGPAVALTGIAANLSRVIGPMIAGALISFVHPGAVFVLNAVLAVATLPWILRWKLAGNPSAFPVERLLGAMRSGMTFTAGSPRFRIAILRIFLFFSQAIALVALLPLVAREMHGGGAATYTLMLASLGLGAIVAALNLSRWNARIGADRLIAIGTFAHAGATALVVAVPELWVALPAIMVAGLAWIPVSNSLTVVAQNMLADWVRARGMAIFQTSMMGGAALGAVVWGQVASMAGVRAAVIGAAAFGVVALLLTRQHRVGDGRELDFTPAPVPERALAELATIDPADGPVVVMIEYCVDPAREAEFAAVMRETRRARLRHGVSAWKLLRDAARAGCYIETFIDEDWIGHQRRLERFSVSDEDLRIRRLAFQHDGRQTVLRRFVAV